MSGVVYRPAIDGLRALAVGSVLLFHLDERLLRGGFVGVDVFFVISGYLITSILVADFDRGRFQFARFYQRRIARIFPAFLAVSAAILIGASFLYSSQDFASVGDVGVAAALSLANLKWMLTGNYFEASQDAQPMLHFWSLAVEEQFYLLFPLLMFLAWRAKLSLRTLTRLLIAAAIVSFLACVVMTFKNPTWAFYLLPTRAWEMLAGCILAIIQFRNEQLGQTRGRPLWPNLGLLLIVLSFFLVPNGPSFPGSLAALPVLGTVFLIGTSGNRSSWAEQLLSWPPLVVIGKVSYSLYLWHWPIYCAVDYAMFTASYAERTACKLALTAVASSLSYLWVESPTRSFLNKPHNLRASLSCFVAGTAALLVCSYVIEVNNFVDADPASVAQGGKAFNLSITRPVVVLMGDSHASMYGKTMKEIAIENRLQAHVICVAGGVPLPETDLYEDSISYLNQSRPDVTVFVVAATSSHRDQEKRIRQAVSEILVHSRYVILITQPPVLPKSASRQSIREHGLSEAWEEEDYHRRRLAGNQFLSSLATDRAHVIDVESLFLKANGEIQFLSERGQSRYHDRTHLSGFGSDLVKPQLTYEILRIIYESTSSDSHTRSNRPITETKSEAVE